MDIGKKEIVPDLRIYEAASVCKDHGRARMKELEIIGTAMTLFIDSGGRERKRLIGYVGLERFLKEIAAVEEETR